MQRFWIDCRQISWEKYMRVYVEGIKEFLFEESRESQPIADKKVAK